MSSNGTMKDFRAMMAEARLPEDTVDVCLRGDLLAEFHALEKQLEQEQESNRDSLASSAGDLLDQMNAIQAQMRDATYPVRLRALKGPAFRQLLADHPPRRLDNGEIDPVERGYDFNVATFFEPLLRACLIDPEITTAGDWAAFVDALTSYQFDELCVRCIILNRGKVDIPFSLAASQMKRPTGGE